MFVLPGIMGSQLTVDDRPVWMNLLELARGGLSLLGRRRTGVNATGLLPDGYAALCEHLGQTHEVVPFPYDWRQPLDDCGASSCATAIDEMLPLAEAAPTSRSGCWRIRWAAWSSATMLADRGGPADLGSACASHPGARFIMLGTPNGGSHAIPAMLIGRDALVKKLALLDLRSDHAALLGTIAGFDGVLNLLPHAGTLDLFDRAVWERLLGARRARVARPVRRRASPPRSRRGSAGRVPGAAALARARRRSPRASATARSTRRASPTSPVRRTRPPAIS